MYEIVGKYNRAKVFAETLDTETHSQIQNLVNQEFVSDSNICIMPDAHAGVSCTIGTTMTIADKVVPSLVGVDIGCSVSVTKLNTKLSPKDTEVFRDIDNIIKKHIPVGFDVRTDEQMDMKPFELDTVRQLARCVELERLHCAHAVDLERGERSLGTLGGGNHFIELANDEDSTYLIIHSGSRKIGLEVAGYYQKLAISKSKNRRRDIDKIIMHHKNAGTPHLIQSAIDEHRKNHPVTADDFPYLTGWDLECYLEDVARLQDFVRMSHSVMKTIIVGVLGGFANTSYSFTTMHNYIDMNRMILRKGAVSANRDEMLIIPMNMRDGSLICRGKGNPDWNYSAPHGAGRIMSRGEARKLLTVEEFKKTMDGIYSSTIGEATLDEAPMAYKPMYSIVDAIGHTVDIVSVIKPIYNMKGA